VGCLIRWAGSSAVRFDLLRRYTHVHSNRSCPVCSNAIPQQPPPVALFKIYIGAEHTDGHGTRQRLSQFDVAPRRQHPFCFRGWASHLLFLTTTPRRRATSMVRPGASPVLIGALITLHVVASSLVLHYFNFRDRHRWKQP
jgi:hypothetical protein